VRVISGVLKGKILKGHDLEGTRPTMDRVKESLFAMIQNNIKDSVCLDLFAGSGSLGIEALSNGAKYVYFIDNKKRAIEIIKDNLKNVDNKHEILLNDYRKALDYFKNNNIHFDLIFLFHIHI
jgi:16S rRNA (guanine966-N2)-methyltransferase